jgi:hypothetical protein
LVGSFLKYRMMYCVALGYLGDSAVLDYNNLDGLSLH